MGRYRSEQRKFSWQFIRSYNDDMARLCSDDLSLTTQEWEYKIRGYYRDVFTDMSVVDWIHFTFSPDTKDFDNKSVAVIVQFNERKSRGEVIALMYEESLVGDASMFSIKSIYGHYSAVFEYLHENAIIYSYGMTYAEHADAVIETCYWTYDNLDAIHIPNDGFIPDSYSGWMCVPSDFLLGIDSDVFEVVGTADMFLTKTYLDEKTGLILPFYSKHPTVHSTRASVTETKNKRNLAFSGKAKGLPGGLMSFPDHDLVIRYKYNRKEPQMRNTVSICQRNHRFSKPSRYVVTEKQIAYLDVLFKKYKKRFPLSLLLDEVACHRLTKKEAIVLITSIKDALGQS